MGYAKKYPMASTALFDWYHEISRTKVSNFNELRSLYGNISLINDDRVVFNIMGNRYRLVVRVVFEFKVVQIKWFGPHKDYDRIDAKTIDHE